MLFRGYLILTLTFKLPLTVENDEKEVALCENRRLRTQWMCRLVSVGHIEQGAFGPEISDQLQADRQAFLR